MLEIKVYLLLYEIRYVWQFVQNLEAALRRKKNTSDDVLKF
jgi:hypothetical protein